MYLRTGNHLIDVHLTLACFSSTFNFIDISKLSKIQVEKKSVYYITFHPLHDLLDDCKSADPLCMPSAC